MSGGAVPANAVREERPSRRVVCDARVRRPRAPKLPCPPAVAVGRRVPTDRTVSVDLDLASLGVPPPVAAIDAMSGQSVTLEAGRLNLPVGWRNFRLIELKAGR